MSDTARNKTVGFIGVGMMGSPMATNILNAGHPLVVYDIDPKKNARLVDLGAKVGNGPADVAKQSRIVVTMVDTTEQSEEVTVLEGGIIDAAQPGDVVLCMSTIDPMAVKKMHEKLSAKGIGIIDSPVTGMVKGATERTLKVFVGGDPRDSGLVPTGSRSDDLRDHSRGGVGPGAYPEAH
jgi:3-hydroxyisobutyrate dehydrogenase-like beta-hydroxyacid dehydrogenase